MRLVSVNPPNFATAKHAQRIDGAVVGGALHWVDTHNTVHSSSLSSVSQLTCSSSSGVSSISRNCNKRTARNAVITNIRSRFAALWKRCLSTPAPRFHAW